MRISKLWLIPAALLVAGGIAAAVAMTPPADLDYSLDHPSDAGLYRVTLVPGVEPVPVGQMHTWTITVAQPDGNPVAATVTFDGGMPQHGHGLPTVPVVSAQAAGGSYTASGVKFNMPGWWKLSVGIEGAAGGDTATFNLKL